MLDFSSIELARSSFSFYTDESSQKDLYRALGMTIRTLDAGPEHKKGAYLHTESELPKAFKIPGNPGHLRQLGGEFLFRASPRVASDVVQTVITFPLASTRPLQLTTYGIQNLTGSQSHECTPASLHTMTDSLAKGVPVEMAYAHRMT